MTEDCEGQKQSTKRFKYTVLKTFFNFIKTTTASNIANPCDTPVLSKTFRLAKGHQWTILEKDVVDEIIFKTNNLRNRVMLELIARGGMRIGEVLKLRVSDVNDRKLSIANPKSGRQSEFVFIPQKVSARLKEYIRQKGLSSIQRIFPIGYTGAREMVKKAGELSVLILDPMI